MVINKINFFLNHKNGRKEKKLELQVGDQALVFFFLGKSDKKKKKKARSFKESNAHPEAH